MKITVTANRETNLKDIYEIPTGHLFKHRNGAVLLKCVDGSVVIVPTFSYVGHYYRDDSWYGERFEDLGLATAEAA